jgi:aldose 1-epimerase
MTAAHETVQLEAGQLSVGLVPTIGGSVSYLRRGGVDAMRPLSVADQAAGNVLGVAMFPMLPYANRIVGNSFAFDGTTYRVEANNPPEKYNVHGTGWHRSWRVESRSDHDAVLSLKVIEPHAAYSYRATQHFTVDDDGLTVLMAIANAGAVAMPFGLGLHPWFERDADVTVQFRAKRFYLEEPEGVSGNAISLPPELDFAAARPLPQGWRNNDYGGWDGVAAIHYPSRGLTLEMRAEPVFGHLMVYADPTKSYFCAEPQTNASGAFNRPGGMSDPDEGVLVLQPGESASGSVRFDVRVR